MGIFSRFAKPKKQSSQTNNATDPAPSDSSLILATEGSRDVVNSEKNAFDGLSPYDLLADKLYRTGYQSGIFNPLDDDLVGGVCVRGIGSTIHASPFDNPRFKPFEDAVEKLGVRVAVKMSCKAVDMVFIKYIDRDPNLSELAVSADTRVQIINELADLPKARRNQYAAFVRDEGALVVWDDDTSHVMSSVKALEEALIKFVTSAPKLTKSLSSVTFSSPPSTPNISPELAQLPVLSPGSESNPAASVQERDPEKGESSLEGDKRPITFIASCVNGLACSCVLFLLSLSADAIIKTYLYSKDAKTLAFLIAFPFYIGCVAIFPSMVAISCLVKIFGPVSQYHQNSQYYSAIPPSRDTGIPLSRLTVQMPVFKESLDSVIIPTLESVKSAVKTYERQGGLANIIVCDDGLQIISDDERKRRIDYYSWHGIAYVARPPQSKDKDGYQRRGRFKKAGNLNYTNTLSLRIEDIIEELRVGEEELTVEMTKDESNEIYKRALEKALEELNGDAWAAGDIRIGDVILLIDSDTRVPVDCLLDASLEFAQSPEVAIIQHASRTMQVAHHFFENAMAFFNNMLQDGISYAVSCGDSAPFIGHNAFLRWSALQECMSIDPYDDKPRVWSEVHVSEDFALSLKLRLHGWISRWVTYSHGEFQEGVSLTCEDELSRWQKYALGCGEIMIHPLYKWPTKGPLTRLFMDFLRCKMPGFNKIGILAYMWSYFAIAVAWSLTLLNFVLVGLLNVDTPLYTTSWNVALTCMMLFNGLCNVSNAILNYRLGRAGGGKILLDMIKWIPFFVIFFSGVSFAISNAFIAHLIGYKMTWTSTSKEVQRSNFFLQLPKIMKRFWIQISLSVVVLAGMIVSTTSLVPLAWRVYNVEAIVPLVIIYGSQLLWPFVFDPYFTTFTF